MWEEEQGVGLGLFAAWALVSPHWLIFFSSGQVFSFSSWPRSARLACGVLGQLLVRSAHARFSFVDMSATALKEPAHNSAHTTTAKPNSHVEEKESSPLHDVPVGARYRLTAEQAEACARDSRLRADTPHRAPQRRTRAHHAAGRHWQVRLHQPLWVTRHPGADRS